MCTSIYVGSYMFLGFKKNQQGPSARVVIFIVGLAVFSIGLAYYLRLSRQPADLAPQAVKLYYYKPDLDKDANGNLMCSRNGLVPVERMVEPQDGLIVNTMRELLLGNLTTEERARGVTTEFPLAGVLLESGELGPDGVLTLILADAQNKTSGGSCRVGILRAQIEATALQFPTVKAVRLLPEELFQPRKTRPAGTILIVLYYL